MPNASLAFLNALDTKLLNAADTLRVSLVAAVYTHTVLGVIFLKVVSESLRMQAVEVAILKRQIRNPAQLGLTR